MKRKVTVVLLALVAALLLGLSVFFVACDVGTESGGNEEDDGIFVFTLYNEGTAYSVIGMDASAAGSVTIPATYNDLPVTRIGASAFFSCRNLTEITIPEGVTSIGSGAFYNCSGLTEITIPASVTSIGSSAFHNCSNLTEINYNAAAVADLTSDSNVFYNAGSNSDGITVTFGESVTSIPAYLFENASANITSVTIGSNVESIGNGAFYGCQSLAEITIPASVTSIGSYAFYGCSSLTEITIPVGVTSIGSSAFYDCIKLIEVFNQSALDITVGSGKNGYIAYYAKNVYTQEGGSWFTDTAEGYRFFYDGNKGYLMGYYGTETELILPAAFTAYYGTEVTEYEIYAYAFCGYRSITSVKIPEGVTSIGEYAFRGCSKLTSVTFENTEGWWRSADSTATSGTEIASSDLADPSTAATYLKSRYYNYYWYRA